MAVEIEFRGPLTKKKFQVLLKLLRKEGKFAKRTKRKTFVFHTNDKTLDLKIRTTDGASEIVLKKGFWGARKREEIILPIDTNQIETAKKFIVALGYGKGIIAIRETYVFEYKRVEFSLVKCPNNYCFYEAEFTGSKSIKNPEIHVQKILKSLGLEVWSEKKVYDFFMFCNKEIDKHFELE